MKTLLWLMLALLLLALAGLAAGVALAVGVNSPVSSTTISRNDDDKAFTAGYNAPSASAHSVPARDINRYVPQDTCGPNSNYTYTVTSGLTPGPVRTPIPGTQCDECVVNVPLPFPVQLYGGVFTGAQLGSNGTIGFVTNPNLPNPLCAVNPPFDTVIFPFHSNLTTASPCGTGCGWFMEPKVVGPDQVIDLELVALSLVSNEPIRITTRLYQPVPPTLDSFFDVFYELPITTTIQSKAGVQKNVSSGLDTTFICGTPLISIPAPLRVRYRQTVCQTPTPTTQPSNTPTVITATSTLTPTGTTTGTPTITGTPTGTSTQTNTPSTTPTRTPTNTPTYSPTRTHTNTPTYSPTRTPTTPPTNTRTRTPTIPPPPPTNTFTRTRTPTNTRTRTPTPPPPPPTNTPTRTPTRTPTNTPTRTPTRTPTTTPTLCPPGVLIVEAQTNGLNNYLELKDTVLYSYSQADPSRYPGDFAIHQTHDPWGFTYLKSRIGGNGYAYSVFTPADLLSRTYANYRVTVLNWDDTNISGFASPYTTAIPDLEYYVRSGGVLWIQTAVDGSGGVSYTLPFSGTATYTTYVTNTIVDTASPLMTGMPNPFTGSPASSMTFSGLPAGAHIVARAPDGLGSVTLYEYRPAGLPPPCLPLSGNTATPTPTSTACPIHFADVPNPSTFYTYVRCLSCRGILSGYPCGGLGEPCNPTSDPYFRPGNVVTRGQITKIVALAANFIEPVSGQTFEDVAPGSTFYDYVERLASRSIMGGYACGGLVEPCIPPGNRPYFRPGGSATRGQIAKIVSNAANFIEPVSGQTFEDVAPGSTFYDYVERLASRSIMGGYPCGGISPPEPCVPPNNRPYFRPGDRVTRGQTSKIVANTFYPDCSTPAR